MSSIRDALRRAERERISRGEQRSVQPSPAPSGEPSRDFKVVGPFIAPLHEVPVELTEEFAKFRQGIEAALPGARRSLLFTSASASEGVTSLTVLLATSLAVRDGKRVCLIDANFKGPSTSRIFDIHGRPGLSDLALGKVELSDALVRTESSDLYVMGVGTELFNPSLIMSKDRARQLPAELGQRFDYVIFDAGPLLTNAESSLLAAAVDGVVLVVRAHRTKREVIAKAEKLVRFSGGRVVGSILNRRQFPIPDSIYKRL